MSYYFIAQIRINDPDEYQKYLDHAGEIFAKFNGEYLAVDSYPQLLEGSWDYSRSVLIRFDSREDFENWYRSDDYQQILKHRLKGADCDTILIKGLDRKPNSFKVTLTRTNSNNEDFRKLTGYLDEELNSRYGQLQEQYNQFNKVDNIQNVVIAYQENQPVGCGCFKVFDQDTIEIKRMYTVPRTRGKGIAGMILSELEQWAVELGFSTVVLETGVKQPEAIRFYRKNGYLQTENWGQYIGNPNSVCMQKKLT